MAATDSGPEAKVSAQSGSSASETPVASPADADKNKDWHPDYGYMKDTFWKDLELGRITNIDIFEGDMYSKVKGSRRAAHAEAMANIQKKEPQTKTSPPPSKQKVTPKMNSKSHIRQGSPKSLSNSPIAKKVSPKVTKSKKRSSDPFSAKGYASNRRNRRQKSVKISSSTEGNSSSATETIGFGAYSASNEALVDDVAFSKTDANLADLGRQDMDEVLNQLAETAAATASDLSLSELDVDAHLDGEIIKPEAIFNLETGRYSKKYRLDLVIFVCNCMPISYKPLHCIVDL